MGTTLRPIGTLFKSLQAVIAIGKRTNRYIAQIFVLSVLCTALITTIGMGSANAQNQPPIANDDAYTTRPNTTLSVDSTNGLLTNDSDQDGDPIEVLSSLDAQYGTIIINKDGSFTYTPFKDFIGVETIPYTITNGTDTASALVTIEVLNQFPKANDDTYEMPHNTELVVGAKSGLLANDTDPDGDPINVVSNEPAQNGSLTIMTDGSFTYTPDKNFEGVETITYTISDGFETASASLSIEVTNQPPVANDDNYSMRPNTELDVDAASGVLANDFDPDGDSIIVLPYSIAQNGVFYILDDGSFFYAPHADFVGTETITYEITDGNETASAMLLIKIGDNQPPVASDDFYSVQPNMELSVDPASGVLVNDTDPDGDPLSVVSNEPAQNGTLNIMTDGSLTYIPDKNFEGIETFTYTISDGYETADAAVTIKVADNRPPIANDDTYTMQPNTELVVDSANGLLANDIDPDGDIIIVESSSTALNGVFIILSLDGAFTYVPDTDFVGVETVTYTITDGPEIDTATVTIEVGNNQPPIAVDDQYSTEVGTLLTVSAENGVLANDSDPEGDDIEVVSFAAVGNGDLNIEVDGAFTYQPYDGFIGDEQIVYTISDGTLTSEGLLLITVEDTPPISENSCEEYDPQPLSRGFGGNWTAQEDEQTANFYVPATQRGGGIIQATLSAGHASITPDLRVCINSSCTGGSIVGHTAIEENGATVEFQAAAGQDYHFDILQFGNAPQEDYPVGYSLTVSYQDRIDCWEDNNTVEQAKEIALGDEVNAYMIEGYKDNQLRSGEYADWYTFEMDQEAFIEINMIQPPGMHLMRVKLFDEPDENVADVLLEGQQEEKGQPFTAKTTRPRAPGTYYLRIGTLLSDDGFVSGSGDQPEHWNQEYEMTVNIKSETPLNFVLDQQNEFPQLTWESSSVASGHRFNIYRGDSPRALEVIETVDAGIFTFVDNQIPEGIYFYAISSVSPGGSESEKTYSLSYVNEFLQAEAAWKLASIPIADSNIEAELAILYRYDEKYFRENRLISLAGYWMKTRSFDTENIFVNGPGLLNTNLNLEKGWNLIGSFSDSLHVDMIVDQGNILTDAPVYIYESGSYVATNYLVPTQGHWIFAEEAGTVNASVQNDNIQVSNSAMPSGQTQAFQIASQQSETEHNIEARLVIENGLSSTHLHIQNTPIGKSQLSAYYLPPLSPDPVLDVRVENNTSLLQSDMEKVFVETSDFPLKLTIESEINEVTAYRMHAYSNNEKSYSVDLIPGQVQRADVEFDYFTLEQIAEDEIVQTDQLINSYPNPFNPSTTIQFELAQTTHVKLEVFDVVGRRVSLLAAEQFQAGQHFVTFRADNLSSGIYFVRFQTPQTVNLWKITLMK